MATSKSQDGDLAKTICLTAGAIVGGALLAEYMDYRNRPDVELDENAVTIEIEEVGDSIQGV